jgi:adenylate cyclase class IV
VARNIEIKARVPDLAAMAARAAALADGGPIEIRQDDTFFACERGRLKLRAFPGGEGQLIFYQRPDRAGPKASFFAIAPTACCDALRDVLRLAYGEAGRVRKHRTLYHVGRTRVHLDRVEGLGDFLELEVVLADGEPPEPGIAEAQALMQRLGVDAHQLIEGAYVDLLPAPHA